MSCQTFPTGPRTLVRALVPDPGIQTIDHKETP